MPCHASHSRDNCDVWCLRGKAGNRRARNKEQRRLIFLSPTQRKVPQTWLHGGRRLNVPMTQGEIATFLDVPGRNVETLWQIGLLKRTVGCAHRPTGAIMHSSPLDVLEYGLASGDLPKKLNSEQAALWVFCLAEVLDEQPRCDQKLTLQATTLYEFAESDGLTQMRPDGQEIAAMMTKQLRRIFALMASTDAAARRALYSTQSERALGGLEGRNA